MYTFGRSLSIMYSSDLCEEYVRFGNVVTHQTHPPALQLPGRPVRFWENRVIHGQKASPTQERHAVMHMDTKLKVSTQKCEESILSPRSRLKWPKSRMFVVRFVPHIAQLPFLARAPHSPFSSPRMRGCCLAHSQMYNLSASQRPHVSRTTLSGTPSPSGAPT